jgi:hypothetical protein
MVQGSVSAGAGRTRPEPAAIDGLQEVAKLCWREGKRSVVGTAPICHDLRARRGIGPVQGDSRIASSST